MNKNGYILLEIMVGFFILGLISTTCLPMMVSSFNNFKNIKDKSEMIYIGEMVVERLRADKSLSLQIICILEEQGSMHFDDSLIDDKYFCFISKIKSTDRLIDIKVSVSKYNQEKSNNVDFRASIPK